MDTLVPRGFMESFYLHLGPKYAIVTHSPLRARCNLKLSTYQIWPKWKLDFQSILQTTLTASKIQRNRAEFECRVHLCFFANNAFTGCGLLSICKALYCQGSASPAFLRQQIHFAHCLEKKPSQPLGQFI